MVQLIQWRDGLSVGHPMIDADHRVLVDMLNALLESLLDNQSNEILASSLDGLMDYARSHFAREEAEMRASAYPDSAAHFREHGEFNRQIGVFKARFDAGDTMLTLGVMKFLRNWLTDHILTVDKRLAGYLNGIGEQH